MRQPNEAEKKKKKMKPQNLKNRTLVQGYCHPSCRNRVFNRKTIFHGFYIHTIAFTSKNKPSAASTRRKHPSPENNNKKQDF